MRTQPKFPAPQPVPKTPIRGRGIVRCDFYSASLLRLAKRLKVKLNSKWAVLKPHRNSVGVIWRGQAFWWSTKGHYRTGKSTGPRRVFHHLLWEHYHGRPLPAGHEIFFRDRDYHNFTKPNLELLSKAALHLRTIEIGEVTQITPEQRAKMASKRWTRAGSRMTGILLDKFNRGESIAVAGLHRDRFDQKIARAEQRALLEKK